MNHLYVCGFNGFQQLREIESSLKSLLNMQDEQGKVSQANKASEVASQQETPEKNSRTASESSIGKRKMEEPHDEAVDTVKKGHFQDQAVSTATFLKNICSFPDNVVVKHVEMTWSRIGITVTVSLETDLREKHHTLVCGFHGSLQQKSEPLQLHLPDCTIRASNQLGLLMQQDDQLLMLGAGTPKAEHLTVVTREEGETKNANAFGCVSGMVSDFVASYDGISVAKLSAAVDLPSDTRKRSDGPRLLLTCLDSGLSVQHVSCGLEHSLFLTQHGTVLTCGSGSRGQLGHGSVENEEVPQAVSALEGVRCVCVAAGGWHCAVLSECGDLYTWGWNECGQLGLPSPALQHTTHHNQKQQRQQQQQQQQQQQCESATGLPPGREKVKPASLHLVPKCVDVVDVGCGQSEDVVLTAVACGTRHTAILSETGKVFTAGWNKYGQLGLAHTDSTDQFSPVCFPGNSATVTQMWCGAWNSLFVIKESVTD